VIVDILPSVIAERTGSRHTAVATYLGEVQAIRDEATDVSAHALITSLFSDHLALIKTLVVRRLESQR